MKLNFLTLCQNLYLSHLLYGTFYKKCFPQKTSNKSRWKIIRFLEIIPHDFSHHTSLSSVSTSWCFCGECESVAPQKWRELDTRYVLWGVFSLITKRLDLPIALLSYKPPHAYVLISIWWWNLSFIFQILPFVFQKMRTVIFLCKHQKSKIDVALL